MSDKDPEFEALLDKMAEEMESQEDEVPLEKHVWDLERAAIFDCDDRKYKCGKCGVRLTVRENQSVNAAMKEHGVLENCAEEAVRAVETY